MDDVNLLPCPFCGSPEVEAVELVGPGHIPPSNEYWSAQCLTCTATIDAATEAEAIAAWNTRAEPTPIPSAEQGELVEATVRHVAAILEEWDMKDPPNAFTGHDYNDIARDIITRTVFRSTPPPSSSVVEELLRDALAFMRGDISGPSQRDGIIREGEAALSHAQENKDD